MYSSIPPTMNSLRYPPVTSHARARRAPTPQATGHTQGARVNGPWPVRIRRTHMAIRSRRRRDRYRYPGRQRAGRDTWWGARSWQWQASPAPGLSACGNGATDRRSTRWGRLHPASPPGVAPCQCQCHRLERSLLAPLILPSLLRSAVRAALRPVHSQLLLLVCVLASGHPTHPAGGALPCTARTAMAMPNAGAVPVRACVSRE